MKVFSLGARRGEGRVVVVEPMAITSRLFWGGKKNDSQKLCYGK